ncbi:unnamed protein product [Urochloa humidicola]
METEGYVSLEEIEEYKYVTNQTFKREEDFYKFYNAYAKKKGFGVRKSNVKLLLKQTAEENRKTPCLKVEESVVSLMIVSETEKHGHLLSIVSLMIVSLHRIVEG